MALQAPTLPNFKRRRQKTVKEKSKLTWREASNVTSGKRHDPALFLCRDPGPRRVCFDPGCDFACSDGPGLGPGPANAPHACLCCLWTEADRLSNPAILFVDL